MLRSTCVNGYKYFRLFLFTFKIQIRDMEVARGFLACKYIAIGSGCKLELSIPLLRYHSSPYTEVGMLHYALLLKRYIALSLLVWRRSTPCALTVVSYAGRHENIPRADRISRYLALTIWRLSSHSQACQHIIHFGCCKLIAPSER